MTTDIAIEGINQGYCLGNGVYGLVYKATFNNEDCAAKILGISVPYPENEAERRSFDALLNTKHCNLVHYLGAGRMSVSDQIVLFMELALENLTMLLQRSNALLPYYLQINLCHDIAKGVAHLHSLGVIHKHLSSNSVLIFPDGTAKIADYIISKLFLGKNKPLRTQETDVYMPPQFFKEVEDYTLSNKWDTFSIGVLIIQICTRQYPKPGTRSVIVHSLTAAHGSSLGENLETKRRQDQIDLIDQNNPLRGFAEKSIANEENDRPTTRQVLDQFEKLKQTHEYAESVREVENNKLLEFKLEKIYHNLDYRISRGAMIRKGTTVYMRTGQSMCSYDFMTQEWKCLPDCPQSFSSLAVVTGMLTAIGGCLEYSKVTNELLCLSNGKWQSGKFSPMPTKRAYSMSFCTDNLLVVAGGATSKTELNAVTIVEVMDLNTKIWSTCKNATLPIPFSGASVTICEDIVYMLGGFDDKGRTKVAIACKLSDITNANSWYMIDETPAYQSTCITIQGQLHAVGGCNKESKVKLDLIYSYNSHKNIWSIVDDVKLSVARSVCHAAVLPGAFEDVLIVGGGDITWRSPSDVAERIIARKPTQRSLSHEHCHWQTVSTVKQEQVKQAESPGTQYHSLITIEGARKLWGTHKAASVAEVHGAITVAAAVRADKFIVKRKYKTNEKNCLVKWWFVVRSEEDNLKELEESWSSLSLPRKWKLQPQTQFRDSEIQVTGPSFESENF